MSTPGFIEINTRDGLTLPGLFYEAKRAKRAAIYLHGNGSSSVFYDEYANRAIGDALAKHNISFLAFNNRGAHLVKKMNVVRGNKVERQCFGMAYEKIKECIHDIDAAIKFLERRGYREFILIGTSTGANKICVYDHYRPKNPISQYVLVAGGDDTGIYYHLLGRRLFRQLLARAKRKIKSHAGEEIITETLPKKIFSHQAFYDIANPDGDYNCFPFLEVMQRVKLSTKPLFRYFKALHRPTMVMYGDQDEYAWGDVPACISILRGYRPDFAYQTIPNANHMFANREKALAKVIARWLR